MAMPDLPRRTRGLGDNLPKTRGLGYNLPKRIRGSGDNLPREQGVQGIIYLGEQGVQKNKGFRG